MWGWEELEEGRRLYCWEVLWKNSGALVSFHRPDQIKKAASVSAKLILDNGAFSHWKNTKLKSEINWELYWIEFYNWLEKWFSFCDWFLIPDVIEGSEAQNNALLLQVPAPFLDKAVPVWHSDESLDRLYLLCSMYPKVAIGMCGPHKVPYSKVALARLSEVFTMVYRDARLKVKLHGLRMLDGRIFGKYPFYSADSANVAVNVPKDKKKVPEIQGKLARTAILKGAIEKVVPPTVEEWLNAA